MKVKIKKLNENASIPKQATQLAGGWDVTVTEIIKTSENSVTCNLGFSLELPEGYRIDIRPRSSITKTNWIMQNSPGLGDGDYRGEYMMKFKCLPKLFRNGQFSYDDFPYNIGERIGQITLEKVIPIEFEEVYELTATIRGDGGYGSTGTN